MKRVLCVAAIALPMILAGCAQEEQAGGNGEDVRGGKSDEQLYGSCAAACGEASHDGTCWCDELCESYGDCCDDYAQTCEAPVFESFRIATGGLCPPGSDCAELIRLDADGTLHHDPRNQPGAPILTATIDTVDLEGAIGELTDTAFLALLEDGPGCSLPEDFSEVMVLELSGVTHSSETTFCDTSPLPQIRELMRDLVAKYIEDPAPPTPAFVSFTLMNGGFCPPGAPDCTRAIEVHGDGTLRYDPANAPGELHTATLTPGDLAATIEVLSDIDLIAILSAEAPPCVGPTDIFETMSLDLGLEEPVMNDTTGCSNPPLPAVRAHLEALVDDYLPL